MHRRLINQRIIEELLISDAEKKMEEKRLALEKKQQEKLLREHQLVATYLKRRFPRTFKEDIVTRMEPREFQFVLRRAKTRAFVCAPFRAIKNLFIALRYFDCGGLRTPVVLLLVVSISSIILLIMRETPTPLGKNIPIIKKDVSGEYGNVNGKYGEAVRAVIQGVDDQLIKDQAFSDIAKKAADNGDYNEALRIVAIMSNSWNSWFWSDHSIPGRALAHIAQKVADNGDYNEAMRIVATINDHSGYPVDSRLPSLLAKQKAIAYITEKIASSVR